MMVLITTSNSKEDSQGAQLRISKKLTTVCSGKRSRFSKPRPNLAICKRGELSVPASTCKTSKNSEGEAVQASQITPVINADENICIIKEQQSNAVTDKKNEEDIQIVSYEKENKEIVKEDIKIISHENYNKKVVEDDVKCISDEDTNKSVLEQVTQIISSTNSDRKYSFDEDIQNISSTDVEKSVSKENVISSAAANKNFKENDIQVRPIKNSGSPLKVPESERRNISIVTPSVIDKSKYPHLTSILSKKRTEPRKEVQQKKRKKFKKGDAPPERSKMTMADLIYWNPAKTEQSEKSAVTVTETPSDNIAVEEESVDDVNESENNVQDSVPKLVISEDGQINIDQSSLFVSRNITQPTSTEVVRKDDTTYSSFRKRPLTKHWTAKDTANFYRALSLVGADFSLMEQIFPNRTRRELKQKFKREEKFNIDLINKVLYESQTFDEFTLNDFMDQNSIPDESILINERDDIQSAGKEKLRKQKTSKKAKSMNDEICDTSINHFEEENEEQIRILQKPSEHEKQNNKGRKKRTKKLSDDEDVEILITNFTNYNNTGDRGSKRKRSLKKLPDDFIDLDNIEDLDLLADYETNNNGAFQETNSLENEENSNVVEIDNDVEEIPSENACTILNKIINGTENTDILQNLKEESSSITVSLPFVTNDDEEYISVEYIKNDSDADLTMLGNVMAYEVVNTQTPISKKKRKINSVSPGKTQELFLATKISPANYTNYTPV